MIKILAVLGFSPAKGKARKERESFSGFLNLAPLRLRGKIFSLG
jgi:hypothetical protein